MRLQALAGFKHRPAVVRHHRAQADAFDETLASEEQDVLVVHAGVGKVTPGGAPTSIAASLQRRKVDRNQRKKLIGRQLPAFDHVAQPLPYDSNNS